MADSGPMGFTANSFASLSLDPPLVLWSPAKASLRYAVFAGAAHFAIHVLASDQHGLMHRFVRGGAGFAGLPPEVTPEGTPVIPGTLARFDCAQHATHDGGDHLIVVGLVLRVATGTGQPLVFSAGRYLDEIIIDGDHALLQKRIVITDSWRYDTLVAIPL